MRPDVSCSYSCIPCILFFERALFIISLRLKLWEVLSIKAFERYPLVAFLPIEVSKIVSCHCNLHGHTDSACALRCLATARILWGLHAYLGARVPLLATRIVFQLRPCLLNFIFIVPMYSMIYWRWSTVGFYIFRSSLNKLHRCTWNVNSHRSWLSLLCLVFVGRFRPT